MKARLPDGYGKQNMNQLMKQAQEMQDKMHQKQAELEEMEYTVSASGGMVDITIKGDYQITSVNIKPEIVQTDDIEMLEDMLAAAFNEAVRTVKENAELEMDAISGGFPSLAGLGGL